MYPHPVTDIVAVSTAPDTISVTVIAHDGAPVRTTWGAAAPDWSDLAAVNLPAFVEPPTPATAPEQGVSRPPSLR